MKTLGGGKGNHGRVIGAEKRGRGPALEPGSGGGLAELLAELGVAADAAAERDQFDPMFPGGSDGFFHEDVDDGLLKRGAQIGQKSRVHMRWIAFRNFGQEITDRGLQSAEAEVFRVRHAARQIEARCVSVARPLFNLRSARITEPEHLSDFIESLAGSVVQGASDDFVISDRANQNGYGVSAAHDQRDIRGDVRFVEKGGEEMALQMIDGEIGLVQSEGQALRDRRADHERTGQARSAGGGKGIDFGDGNLRIPKGVLEELRGVEEMISGGHFGHNPAVFLVFGYLRGHFTSQQLTVAQDGDSRLVTGSLEREDGWHLGGV